MNVPERFLITRAVSVQIVLAQEDDGQLPQRRHVERFVESTDVGRAVTETDDRDPAIALDL
jgi:hypothetical protein